MIIAVVGPTGVGKTKMSVELAKIFNAEIINSDSTQVFRRINIGTAKVSEEEMDGVVHHLIDIKDLDEEYSVYDYQLDARTYIDKILKNGKNVIIAGGSNMYLSALLYDYKFNKEDNVYDLDSLSNDEMYAELKKLNLNLDIDRKNRQRLIRYYAKYVNNSEPLEVNGSNLIYDVKFVGLTTNREILHTRINKRVELMIESGLIPEVRELYNEYRDSKQLHNTIGYKEIIKYINGCDLETAITEIKQNSRNYAKRQYTWLNNKMDIKWFEVDFNNFNATVKQVEEYIQKN